MWTVIAALGIGLNALAFFAPPETEEGFKPLFDGKTLEGWEPVSSTEGNWLVQDGLLVTKGMGGGWLSTDKEYGDFVLRLEYKTEPGGNSGVQFRTPREGNPAVDGMEIQILDDDHEMYKTLQPYQYCGSVYGIFPAERGHIKPAGEWNEMEITAKGTKMTVKINGETVVDGDLKDRPDAEELHPGMYRPKGYIGLQSHSDPVQFRNVRIKEL